MRNLILLVQKLQSILISWGKKIIPLNDFATMLCFMLGVYGERFFLYIYSRLGTISPRMFSFMSLICAYFILDKFIHK